ncbi:MAG: hypothetical protein JSR15_10470 [Proteobacteria bacterium]|nr:hypothetical protein [Pseudomonadota bacterium]
MNSIFKTCIAASLLALAAVAGTASAQLPPNTVVEGSIETQTDAVIFPSGLDGRVTVRNCVGCLHSTLQLDANTVCILAGQRVALRDLAAYASRTSGKPLTVTYRLRDLVVSRISVLGK